MRYLIFLNRINSQGRGASYKCTNNILAEMLERDHYLKCCLWLLLVKDWCPSPTHHLSLCSCEWCTVCESLPCLLETFEWCWV